MARKRKTADREPGSRHQVFRDLLWVVAAGVWMLVSAAMLSYDPADWPGHMVALYNDPPHNWVGIVGAVAAHKIYLMLGPGAWIMVAGGAAAIIALGMKRTVTQPILRALGLLIMALSASAMIGLIAPVGLPLVSIEGGRPEGSGGLVALFINDQLTERFNAPGTMLVLFVGFWLGAVLAMDEIVLALPRLMGHLVARLRSIPLPSPVLVGRLPRLPVLAYLGSIATSAVPRPMRRGVDEDEEEDDEEEVDSETDDDDESEPRVRSGRANRQRRATPPKQVEQSADGPLEEDEREDEDDKPAGDQNAIEVDGESADTDEPVKDGHGGLSRDQLRDKIRKLPINFAAPANAPSSASGATGGGIGRDVDLSGYRFPDLSLLEDTEEHFSHEHERIVRDQAVALESALQEYRIEGEVVGIDSGPVIALYEVRLAPGTKVSRITAIASDLARALKAQNIRIVPNMVGKDTVGIEVPNIKKQMVRIKDLMTANPDLPHRMKLPMWLGKDASGNPLVADLTTMPHMLIAGTTGSGKSVCINAIITSFLFTKRPDELKLVLIDPKMVELSMFKDIPHLMCPVVTEMPKATAILEWATTKMDERYELLAEAAVRDVAGYNSLTWEQLKDRFKPESEAEEARIPKKLPYIVFVIDELADLMMTAKETEGFIVRLAQKARAVGLHLILATQRPQANVVTGLIKGNMPCRISFKVASGLDSRIVLDQKGAEVLLGQGDMLYLSPRTSKLKRAQGTFVEDLEIHRTARFLRDVAKPSFEPQLVQIKDHNFSEADEERDPMFDDAVRVVLESRRGSVSLLQRRLAIGYSRASRLIEQMAAVGLIGDYKGSQAREVTMTLDEYETLMAEAQADADAAAAEAQTSPTQDDQDTHDDVDQTADEQDAWDKPQTEYEEQTQDEAEDEAEEEEDEEEEEEEDNTEYENSESDEEEVGEYEEVADEGEDEDEEEEEEDEEPEKE